MTTQGTIDVVRNARPQLALTGDWQQFRWPLRGEAPAVRSSAGRYRLDGDRPYRIDGEGDLSVATFAPMPFKATLRDNSPDLMTFTVLISSPTRPV